ncbi:hypothetical protein ACQ4LE_002811 [Meloidogyne hapla]
MCNSFNPLLIIGLLNLFISFSLFALFFQLRCEDIKFYAEQRKFLLYNYTETYQKTIELFNGKNDNIWREINKFIIYNDLLPITTFFLISGFFCLAFSQFTGSNMSYDQSRTNDLEQNKKEIFYNFFIKNKQKLQQVFKEFSINKQTNQLSNKIKKYVDILIKNLKKFISLISNFFDFPTFLVGIMFAISFISFFTIFYLNIDDLINNKMDKQLYRILFKDEFILFFIGTIFGISSLFYSFMIYDQRQKWKKFYKILEQWEKEEEEKKLKKNLTV